MNGATGAALLLGTALALTPGNPRRRLLRRGHRAVALPRRMWVAGTGAVGLGCLIAGGPSVTVAVALLGVTVMALARRRTAARRSVRDGQEMAAALDVLVSELRVGTHPVRAFEVAAQESGGTVAAAFRAVAARAVLGADVPAGLRSAGPTSDRPSDWERMAVFWQLASDHGLAIATLMRAAYLDIVERQRFRSRVEAGMAGARATASILAGLPVLGVILGQMMGARPVTFLISGGAGGWFLVIGVTLVCGGLLWADRITGRAVT